MSTTVPSNDQHREAQTLTDAPSLHTLYQVSTSGALVQGVYERAVSSRVLLNHGDFGLGTFENLDGEMVVLEGEIFQVRGDGTVTKIVNDVGTPFAVVVPFVADQDYTIEAAASFHDLTAICDRYRDSDNLFYAFRVDAHFSSVRTRAVKATTERLAKAAEVQPEFNFTDVIGTLVGIWAPPFSSAFNIAGYHLHFLSSDRTKGGHLLDCSGVNLRIRVQRLNDFHLSLPESEEFLHADLSKDPSKELAYAEQSKTKGDAQVPTEQKTSQSQTGADIAVGKRQPQTGADVVVETLERHGVKWVFGIPGAKIDKVFDTLVNSKIKTVVCRHEQNAAFIAGGIGRMTGKAGVAIGTSGPGVSNLITGLATANSEGDPVVALGGAVAVSERLKLLHQALDNVALCKPVTKYCVEIDSAESVGEVMANAFRAAESGRPGAAFVSLPKDIMAKPAECSVLPVLKCAGSGPAEPSAVREAAKLLNQSKNPVVLIGLLGSRPENAAAIYHFIESGNLPFVGTFQAAGTAPLPLFHNFGGRVGLMANQPADRILDAADLIITIGYGTIEYEPSLWNKNKNRQLVHIDAVAADIDNTYDPTVELTGDIAETLQALTPLISHTEPGGVIGQLLNQIAEERKELAVASARMNGTPVHPLRLVSEIQQLMTPDMTVCSDMGSFHMWLARHLYSFRARQVLISNGQQTLGVGLPWGIAATLVRPAEKVLSISGDGGFLFSAMELETAVRLQSNLVHMIWIDGTYDMVAVQELKKYGRPSGTDFGPVDPVKYAEAFGAKGFMIQSADQISPVLKKAFDTPGPVLVGVHVDYRDNHKLWEQVDDSGLH